MFSVLTILYRSIAVSEDVVLKYSMYMSVVRFKKKIKNNNNNNILKTLPVLQSLTPCTDSQSLIDKNINQSYNLLQSAILGHRVLKQFSSLVSFHSLCSLFRGHIVSWSLNDVWGIDPLWPLNVQLLSKPIPWHLVSHKAAILLQMEEKQPKTPASLWFTILLA